MKLHTIYIFFKNARSFKTFIFVSLRCKSEMKFSVFRMYQYGVTFFWIYGVSLRLEYAYAL